MAFDIVIRAPAGGGGTYSIALDEEEAGDTSLPWRPVLAEPRRRRVAIAAIAASFFAPPSVSEAAPANDPLQAQPVYPDRVPGRIRRVAETQTVAPITPGDMPSGATLEWLPSYPDRLNPPQRVPHSFSVGPIEPGSIGTGDTLPWLPTYPSRIAKKGQVAQTQTVVPVTVDVPAQGATLEWLPEYPDRVPGKRRPVPVGFSIGPITPGDMPSGATLEWLPVFPDRIARKGRAAVAAIVTPPDPVPQIEWLPSYPDWIAGKRVHPSTAGFFAYVPATEVASGPTLEWLPIYPDFARGRSPLRDYGFIANPITAGNAPVATVPGSWTSVELARVDTGVDAAETQTSVETDNTTTSGRLTPSRTRGRLTTR